MNERVGAVVAVNTYSIRGNFTPDEALRALRRLDEPEPAKRVDPIVVNIGDAFANLARYEATLDPRTMPHGMGHTVGFGHPNCRSTAFEAGFRDNGGKPTEVGGIMAARAALRKAVKDGKPIALRRKIQRHITTLLKARVRKAKRAGKRRLKSGKR